MPSTTSSSVSSDFASSTVITPSLPTFCIASAIIRPISRSLLAETVPTCAISSLVETFLDRFPISATTTSTARSMPRFRSIGFMPAATALAPSRTIAWARTVAVVVPSPARSLVFDATSRTICAPIFSNLSASSISLATVTPSLLMRGARPFTEQHPVANLDVERMQLAVVAAASGPGSDDFALHWLFLGGIGDDDPAYRLLFLFDAADQHAILQRSKIHWTPP